MEEVIKDITSQDYKYGFTTDVETDIIPTGLNEDVIRLISAKKNEPEWLLEFRLKAYRKWLTMEVPTWAHLDIPQIDFQAISYYAAPKTKAESTNKEIDPEVMKTFDKLGIPLEERAALAGNMAVDAVMDSVSVKTTFRETLAEKGIIFCSISEAVKDHPRNIRGEHKPRGIASPWCSRAAAGRSRSYRVRRSSRNTCSAGIFRRG